MEDRLQATIRVYIVVLFVFISLFGSALSVSSSCVDCRFKLNASIKSNEVLSFNATQYSASKSIDSKIPIVTIGDGKASEIWDEVIHYPISTYGDSVGSISSVYDESFVYFHISESIDVKWVALQWDSDNSTDPEQFKEQELIPMDNGDDMWVFGNTVETKAYGDSKANGQQTPFITPDLQDDLYWEKILVNDTEQNPLKITYELMRRLDTKDKNGNDVVFSPNYNVTALLASDLNHKVEAKITTMKFVLSQNKVGNGSQVELVDFDPSLKKIKNVPFYFFTHLTIGFFIGSTSFFIITVISIKSINKELNQ